MTAYERFKAFALICLSVFLVSLSVAVYRLQQSWAATPGELRATLAQASLTLRSLSGVGPQAVSTLKAVQTTTTSVGQQATVTLRSAGGTVGKAGKTLDGLTDTLALVNRPCGLSSVAEVGIATAAPAPLLPCGTLADVNKTLATVRGTFGQIEVAANHEDRNLSTLDKQEAQLYSDVHTTTSDLNTLIASPDIKRFLAASADTSIQVAAIATDVHKEADALTAPKPWYTKLGAYGTTGVNIVCIATHSCPF